MLVLNEKEVKELYGYVKDCALTDCSRCDYTLETADACPTAYWATRFSEALELPGVCRLLREEAGAA